MVEILYLHGFLSSPLSGKAQATGDWLALHRPQWRFTCPQLPVDPEHCRDFLHQLATPGDTLVIGSSLGGFWACYMLENGLAQRAVLINPAVEPFDYFAPMLGQPLRHYHSDETFILRRQHLDALEAMTSSALAYPENYWVLLQTGDETLDYRLAQKKFARARLTVEEGGSHAFENYPEKLPMIFDFLSSQA